jgi:hypothetical protein
MSRGGYFSIRLARSPTKRLRRTANLSYPVLASWLKQKRKARIGFNPKTQGVRRLDGVSVSDRLVEILGSGTAPEGAEITLSGG